MRPTDFETELAKLSRRLPDTTEEHAKLFVQLREALLKPFVDMQHDFEQLGDETVASQLREHIAAARGHA